MKLVKQTASFPFVAYLLAFDARVVEAALADNKVDGGREYLEKIIQAQFAVPLPDVTLLRHELLAELDLVLAPYQIALPLGAGYP